MAYVRPRWVLHAARNLSPRELSSVRIIWEFSVIAEVCTVTSVWPAGIAMLPAAAVPQDAVEVGEAQFTCVEAVSNPSFVVCKPLEFITTGPATSSLPLVSHTTPE